MTETFVVARCLVCTEVIPVENGDMSCIVQIDGMRWLGCIDCRPVLWTIVLDGLALNLPVLFECNAMAVVARQDLPEVSHAQLVLAFYRGKLALAGCDVVRG